MENTASFKAYDIRSCQTKTLAVRILQGYEIAKSKCEHCGVPMMEYKGKTSCVVCPKLVDSIAEGEEDCGVEVINSLLSGSMLGSMSSSQNSQQSGRNQREELDNSRRSSMKSSYSIESEEDLFASNEADETSVEKPSAAAHADSVAKTDRLEEHMTTPPANETKENDFKNELFMKKIKKIGEMAKEQKKLQALNTHHVSFSLEPPASKSPAHARKNGQAAPMHACKSPKYATKHLSINSIAGDKSAKLCNMPDWESKINSVTKENLLGKIKTVASTDKELVNSVAKASHQPRDDGFFSELRQKAANKAKVASNPTHAVVDTGDFRTRNSPATEEDIVEREFKLHQQRWRSAEMRKMQEERMEKSMTNYKRNNLTLSEIPADEMKALAAQRIIEQTVPEPFDEKQESPVDEPEKEVFENTDNLRKVTNEALGEAKRDLSNKVLENTENLLKVTNETLDEAKLDLSNKVLENTENLLKVTNEALSETKLHLSNRVFENTENLLKITNEALSETKLHLSKKKQQNHMPSSSASLSDSIKEHAKRIVDLEAKTLQKYTSAALATTNPNPSSASLKSLSTAEKNKRHMFRSRVVELEAEALRKHSEAALAALNARQALDKMMQNRKKNNNDNSKVEKISDDDKKQPKNEDLSISSSLSTTESSDSQEEAESHQSFSVESASMSQYSGRYDYRQSIDDGSREEEASVLTPPREGRSRKTERDVNPPELNVRSHTRSYEYHRKERERPSRSRSTPRSGMPANIMLPSLQSSDASSRERVYHASPRQSRDRPSRPHLLPYSPRTTPRISSRQTAKPTRRSFSHRPFSPSPDLYRSPNKFHGSMTPRTVHEQQRFDYNENQFASRNLESMMLASNQTVQEKRMMMDKQPPRKVYPHNKPTRRPFPHRPCSPSPDLYRSPNKFHGSMTPRTVHEQQRFDYNKNQFESRNLESMMLASNQTVQEKRMMMDQQPPRMVYSNNLSTMAQQGMMMHNQSSVMPPQGMQGHPPQVQQQGVMMPQQQLHNPNSGYPSGSYPSGAALHQQQQIQPQQMSLFQTATGGNEPAAPPPSQQTQMPILQQPVQPNNLYHHDQEQMMNRVHYDRVINQQQPRMEISRNHITPEQMIYQQRPRLDHYFPGAQFDPATQSSQLNSPKVQFAHPHETQFDREANVPYVNPNVYMLDSRNDYPSMRYNGATMR